MSWLARIHLPQRTERALTEAVLDWRHESADRRGFPRIVAELRGVLAFTRALVGVFAEEASHLRASAVMPAFAVGFALCGLLPFLFAQDFELMNLPNVRSRAIWMATRMCVSTLPGACLIAVAFARRDRELPAVAIMGWGLLVVVAMVVAEAFAWRNFDTHAIFRNVILLGPPFWVEALGAAVRMLALGLLADAVRRDPRRSAMVAGYLAVVIALMSLGLVRRPYVPVPQAVALQRAWLRFAVGVVPKLVGPLTDFPLPVLPLFLWYLLVRRQHRASTPTADFA